MRTMLLLLTLATSARAQSDLKLSPPSSFSEHNRRVERAFLRFATRQTPERERNRLELMRDRDRLLLFQDRSTDQTGYGIALFGVVTVLAAHAPPPLRRLFEGPVHLGPAIFDPGGMGAGIGVHFL
jgi:hypothetical protein